MDNFTDKSSEAIKSSFNLAEEHHNSQGEFSHTSVTVDSLPTSRGRVVSDRRSMSHEI